MHSTVLGIRISILNMYEKLGKVAPGLSNSRISVLISWAVVLQWERLVYSLARWLSHSVATSFSG